MENKKTTAPVKKRDAWKNVNTVISVILWIFLVFSALVSVIALTSTANENNVPNLFGYSLMNVLTDSMDCEDGEMKKGDLILVKLLDDEDLDDLEEGAIISFFDWDLPTVDGNLQINTHRIVDITRSNGTFISAQTKGDNPAAGVDKTLRSREDIVGVYVKNLGGIGDAYAYLRTSNGFLFCIEIPLILFFIYEVFVVVKNVVEFKNRDKKIITEEDEELIRREAIAEYLRQQEEEKAKAENPGETEDPAPQEDLPPQDDNKK